jgi:lipoprotein-anchoring transpeptidase ErfK/SrfK
VRVLAVLPLVVAALAAPQAAQSQTAALSWQAPTPAEGATLAAKPGAALQVPVTAGLANTSAVVRITAGPLPSGATLTSADGNPARATLVWKPKARHVGAHRITFSAQALGLPVSAPRSIVVRVVRPQPRYPQRVVLSGQDETYRWAYVVRPTVARAAPRRSARPLTRLATVTPEHYPNLVLTLDGVRRSKREEWVRVRLAVLPNNSTGWVPRRALGRFRTIRTRLVVDRSRFRATLYKAGKVIFTTRVGVGTSYWPTPRGEFYIRQKMTGYNLPVYGPWAFGLNARSAVLTDWPGGGFIGIHGTNQPGVLPGAVSHGCIRMRNAAISRLARILPLGTPVTVF